MKCSRSIPIRIWVPRSAVVKIAAFHYSRARGRRSLPISTGCLPARDSYTLPYLCSSLKQLFKHSVYNEDVKIMAAQCVL